MKRRGWFLIAHGFVLVAFVPLFLVHAPRLSHPAASPPPEQMEALATEAASVRWPVQWLAPDWIWFVQRTVSKWQAATTADERATALADLPEAIDGLHRIYTLRVMVWVLLAVSCMAAGLLIAIDRLHASALLVILAWLGGSPFPQQLSTQLPDDNDAILLAGLLPMLVAASVVLQRGFQLLAHLARTRPRIGRPVMVAVLLLIFGIALAATIADGGIDERTLALSALGTGVSILVLAALLLLRRR